MDIRALQLDVQHFSYDFPSQTGILKFAENEFCNMSTCIAFFEDIDPQVQTIRTFSGALPDTSYHRDNDNPGGWIAKVAWTAKKAAA